MFTPLLAALEPAQAPWFTVLLETLGYIFLGLLLLAASAKITDWLTPGKLMAEIFGRQNLALAIVTIGSWVGDGIIVKAVVGGGNGDASHAWLIPFATAAGLNVVLNTVAYVILGIVIKALVYIAFDKLTPQFKFGQELAANNTSVAVLLGGLFVAVSLVIAGPLGG